MVGKRLAAVVSGSHHDISGLIKLLGNFMRMHAINSERDNADAGNWWLGGVDMNAVVLYQPVNQPFRKRFFIVLDIFHANLLEILSSNTKTNSSANIREFLLRISGSLLRL